MDGEIDGTFQTLQRDMFTSGLVAEIGVNAFGVWSAIKCYADFSTGQAWPGMREIGGKIGLSKSSVQRAIEILLRAHLLRVVSGSKFRNKGQTYVARERLAVRLGGKIVCYVCVDYVPAHLRRRINRINQSLRTGEHDPDAWAEVEIIPGQGFLWDPVAGTLKSSISASALPASPSAESDDYHRQLGEEIFSKIAPVAAKKLAGGGCG